MSNDESQEQNQGNSEAIEPEVVQKPRKRRREPGRAGSFGDKDRARVVALAQGGATHKEIAHHTGVSPSTVANILKEFRAVLKNIDSANGFRVKRADILAAAQSEVLKSALAPSKLKKASLYQGIKAFDTLHKAERLELGKSTENHAHGIAHIPLPSSRGDDDE